MKKVLILGAGMVANPIIQHLLSKNIRLTVAALNYDEAKRMVGQAENGKAVHWTVDDQAGLNTMVAENDVVVSLIPYAFHVMVAKCCLKHKKHLVTASYAKPEMYALDAAAKEAGVIFLNEVGLDPGIDHMSAMRIIDHVHGKGGKIEAFYSLCGALPAPESCDNPFNYKFSWSPKGVVLAGNNDAVYLMKGKKVEIPTADLFKNPMIVDFPEVGPMDVYPNRDSLSYVDIYGIPETKTMFRGTFRFKGWCETLDVMKALKCTLPEKHDFSGKTFAGAVALVNGLSDEKNIKKQVAALLHIDENAYALNAMEWLGLFSNTPMNRTEDSMYEITSDLMIEKMMITENDRDMVVMMHVFKAVYPDGTAEIIKSRMLDYGTLKTDTSIARTVALPAATAVEMILNNEINITGVHIPVIPEIYKPILDNLEKLNIKMVEEYGLPLTEEL
ncbi:MAG TPA: saccharopine dehydrogenase C-terminal domain-containing protein [Bacteroidales bacterium]|jgi:saccharopine dehydrogenase-like NADP-dependent oxidoreductase|nr:saccharopine dehydrogenase NADP-binding domain-containing protein [Bacteroidales bacterium]HNZ42620.1 saccharopine dehydrogenase C-terminal domain-containing protein [Bacteroidales bacterium]HPI30828.1 saccharopine dehydrogenase C-terminal domain-containing protein [Bacteroidales bacterium]HQN16642.1 saccharopine dehydrogenase C-terminal domain-containing protein [Bacteroidales bacterium]HQP16380.1 saccharopine dehydrogenase C-terminal domain-containing protein [Bacteroidales bacterium]